MYSIYTVLVLLALTNHDQFTSSQSGRFDVKVITLLLWLTFYLLVFIFYFGECKPIPKPVRFSQSLSWSYPSPSILSSLNTIKVLNDSGHTVHDHAVRDSFRIVYPEARVRNRLELWPLRMRRMLAALLVYRAAPYLSEILCMPKPASVFYPV